MKEELIKIKVPDGKKAVQNVDSNGNIVIKFEDVEPNPNRSRSWAEFCRNNPDVEHEWCIFESEIAGPITLHSNRDVVSDKDYLETKEDAEGILALIQLTRLHDEWVGNWEKAPKDEAATIFRRSNNELTVDYTLYRTSLFQFPTKKMAKEFFNCFKDLIEKARRFI